MFQIGVLVIVCILMNYYIQGGSVPKKAPPSSNPLCFTPPGKQSLTTVQSVIISAPVDSDADGDGLNYDVAVTITFTPNIEIKTGNTKFDISFQKNNVPFGAPMSFDPCTYSIYFSPYCPFAAGIKYTTSNLGYNSEGKGKLLTYLNFKLLFSLFK